MKENRDNKIGLLYCLNESYFREGYKKNYESLGICPTWVYLVWTTKKFGQVLLLSTLPTFLTFVRILLVNNYVRYHQGHL